MSRPMIKTNAIMRDLLDAALRSEKSAAFQLDKGLSKLLRGGLSLVDGALLLASMTKGPLPKCSDFPDLTGFECFVNHIHLEDAVADRNLVKDPKSLLPHAIRMHRPVTSERNQRFPDLPLKFIVSLDESGCVWRFHVVRENEPWVADDLDAYEQEALLVMDR